MPADDGFTVERARLCLSLYFEKDMAAQDRADMLELFAKALHHLPKWAVAKGFDQWERTGTRRPSPGEVVILAERAIKEITDELARRKRMQEVYEPDPERKPADPADPAEAERILARAGFTPKLMADLEASPMATSMAEAADQAEKITVKHWSEWGTETDKARLAAARDANPLIQAARISQARKAKE